METTIHVLQRAVAKKINAFFAADRRQALLVTGARQVGKTTLIRNLGREAFPHFVEINFLENPAARKLFENAADSSDLLLRLSALAGQSLVPGKTLIFLDEVQECKEIVTAIKFLVEEGSYRYILSGSLLGVELKDIRSAPVGYMDVLEMFPMDLAEFARANGVSDRVMEHLQRCYDQKQEVEPLIHQKMMELFRLYLLVGGMPAAVECYLRTRNLYEVAQVQQSILTLYKKDIARYDPQEKLYLEDIFDLIPSELNAKNKRFILKDLHQDFKLSRYRNSFLWLANAGVALPTYNVEEPALPLRLNRQSNLFKLFLCDVGLLAATYANGIQLALLNGETNINYGAVFENAAAQELVAHGYALYYFNSKKQGELDFVIEHEGNVLPLEIKSGKDYTRHNALSGVMANPDYHIPAAFVFHGGNVSVKEKITYYPIYMMMFLREPELAQGLTYTPDFGVLMG